MIESSAGAGSSASHASVVVIYGLNARLGGCLLSSCTAHSVSMPIEMNAVVKVCLEC